MCFIKCEYANEDGLSLVKTTNHQNAEGYLNKSMVTKVLYSHRVRKLCSTIVLKKDVLVLCVTLQEIISHTRGTLDSSFYLHPSMKI